MKTIGPLRKEFALFLRDRRLVLAALIVIVLALAAIVTGVGQVRAYERDRAVTEARDVQTWLGQGPRNPHTAAHLSLWALRPLSAPAVLEPGVFPFAGSSIWMEAHSQNPARNRPVEDQVSGLGLGQFSIAWILQALLPLVIGIIAASSISRERESGTLRLALASGTTPSKFVIGKTGAALLVAIVLGAPLIGTALAAAAFTTDGVAASQAAALLLWAGAYAVWLCIVALLAVGVSALSRTTATATLVMIGLWLTAVVIAPRIGVSLADAVTPTPAADRFWSNVSADLEKFPPDIEQKFEASVLKKYGVSKTEDLPVSYAGLQLEWGEGIGHQVFEPNFKRLAETYASQRAVMRWANVISPLPALQNISMALAGTDQLHQQAFQVQAEQHRRLVVGRLNTDMVANARGQDFSYKAGPELWKTIPRFIYRPSSLTVSLSSVWADVLILLGWLCLAVVFCSMAGRRLGRSLS